MGTQYHRRKDLERGRAARHASYHTVLEPPINQLAVPDAPRQRYRATQYDNPMYDIVEDDDHYDQGESFDSFETTSAAVRRPSETGCTGRGRLSLAPGPSNYFSNAAPPQTQAAYHARRASIYKPEQATHGQLSRFAYNDTQPFQSSSDLQVGPSSNPALRAGQRREEHNTLAICHRDPRTQLYKNERRHTRTGQYQELTQTRQDAASSRLVVDEHEGHFPVMRQEQQIPRSYERESPTREQPELTDLPASPMVQGIRLVPITTLPDRLRTVFPFPTFNAVQSKCFNKVFKSDDNFVLASPTGSGKTAILELAVCRAVATNATGQYKVVYQAPTKALCSERQRDWETKFNQVGLKCAELTGDSDASDLRNVQSANVIITTPEKWDSITRKWKDHEKLMRLIKLFLIDEVHILKEDRGAVLEAVVSRMKSIGTDVRFVALSATVPNFRDVAAWLGKSPAEPHEPAANENFGEEFRPVKLRRHVCGYAYSNSNDFAFEKSLDARLPEVISKYSEGKPIMIFCATRSSTANTARLIANWWISNHNRDRLWKSPTNPPVLLNKDLRDTVASGVVFHHAGLDLNDRLQVEKGFLNGEIGVICCTSTLAVGVNLPCHLVIIKNTMAFTAEGLQEYSDLEMMQMLGRAGRPQFDDSAVAVIMTRQNKVRQYEMMVTGQELLESKLHLNLIDHLNAEIGLGTIRDLPSARKWLTGTFLYVRLQHNPNHYKLKGAASGQTIAGHVDDICFREITLLRDSNLVSGKEYFQCTEFGHAMARYYVHFETMKVFMGIQSKSSPSEILSAIAQASEFSQIRFRQGEKALYKVLNRSPSIRWSIPVNLDIPAQKVSLIIQSVLGSADISWDGEMMKHKAQYTAETQIVFKNINSLIRCIIDCQLCVGDSTSIHSALLLERSLGARAWDDSPLQMKQVEGIGVVAVRKFVNAGIRCMDDLEACEPSRIEALVGRNPPFGLRILEKAKQFPKLRVSLHAQPSSTMKAPEGVKIQVKADIGFIDDKPLQRFGNKLIYVCLLAETSDGRKVHFARISGPKLGPGQSLMFPALLTSADQSINCYVMCDGIAGSMRAATVKPQIAPAMFPVPKPPESDTLHQPNMSKRRIETMKAVRKQSATSEDFGDDDIDDDELMKVSFGDLEFDHIENYANPVDNITRKNTAKNRSKDKTGTKPMRSTSKDDDQEPVQLANGKWACNHPCKDRNACKHLCCKNGMDKPPKKKTTAKHAASGEDLSRPRQKEVIQKGKETQTKIQLTASKRKISAAIEELDLTQQEKKSKADHAINGPRDFRQLYQLHNNIQGNDLPSSLHSVMNKKPAYCYSQGCEHGLSFMQEPTMEHSQTSSDYGDIQLNEFYSRPHDPDQDLIQLGDAQEPDEYTDRPEIAPGTSCGSETFGDDDSLLADAMIGLADSQRLQTVGNNDDDAIYALEEASDQEIDAGYLDKNFPIQFKSNTVDSYDTSKGPPTQSAAYDRKSMVQKPQTSLHNRNISLPASRGGLKSDQNILKESGLTEPKQPKAVPLISRQKSIELATQQEYDVLDLLDMVEAQPAKDVTAQEKPVPEAFKDLEPWLFKEFGDIVELVDE